MEMETTFGYSVYAMMRIHLEQANYAEVVQLGEQPITTRPQLTYLAHAHSVYCESDWSIAGASAPQF